MEETSTQAREPDSPETRRQPLSRRARRRLIAVAAAMVATLLFLVLLPLAIEWLIEYRLRNDIATRAEVLDVDFNPFTGRVRITGVNTEHTGGRLAESGELYAEVRWRSLFDEELHLVAVALRRAVMVVRYTEQGTWQVGRIEFGGEEASPGDEELPAWFFSIEEALLEDVSVELHGPGWKDTLHIDNARLAGLKTRDPARSVTLDVAGRIDDVPFNLAVQATPFAAEPHVQGRLDLERLHASSLDWVTQLLQRDGVSLGTSVEAHLDFDMSQGATTVVALDGALTMAEFMAAADGVDERLDSIDYRGRIEVEIGQSRIRNLLDGTLTVTGYRHGMPAEGDLVGIHQVEWKGRFETDQKDDGTLLARHEGGGKGSGIRFRTDALDVAVDALEWQGDYRLDGGENGLTLALEGALHGRQLAIANSEPAATAKVGSVDWTIRDLQAAFGLDGFKADIPGRLAFSDVAIDSPSGKLAEPGTLAWEGDVHIADSGAKVAASGELTTASLAVTVAGEEGEDYAVDLAALGWRGDVNTAPGGAVDMRGTLALKSLGADGGALGRSTLEGLTWEGRVAVDEGGRGSTTGDLAIASIEASDPSGQVARVESLDWKGTLASTPASGASVARIDAQGELAAATVSVRDAEMTWVEAASVGLRGIDLAQPGAVRLDGFSTGDLRVMQPRAGEPLAVSGSLRVGGIEHREDGRVSVDTLQIDALQLYLVRTEEGLVIPGLDSATAPEPEPPVAGDRPAAAPSEEDSPAPSRASGPDGKRDEGLDKPVAAPEPEADKASDRPADGTAAVVETSPGWRLGRFELGPGSRLVFDDSAVAPPFHTEMLFERLQLDNLATGAESPPGDLSLAARMGEYARLEIGGTLRPDPLLVDLSGKLTEVELPPLSPYTLTHLGHKIGSGQLTADLQLRVDGEQLAGEQQLTLNQVVFEAVPSPALDAFENQIGMPLDAALGLLRDKQGNIRLKLPIGGRLDDPEFDLGDAIGQALGKATKTAMIGILKLTLQPYGAILTAVELAGELAANVRLDPLPFDAGASALGSSAPEYLERLGKLLQERPGLQLRLCGRAVEADRVALATALAELQAKQAPAAKPAGADSADSADSASAKPDTPVVAPLPVIDDEQLLALATQRAEVVKRALVDAGAPSERLFLCHPALDAESDAVPRLDLLL